MSSGLYRSASIDAHYQAVPQPTDSNILPGSPDVELEGDAWDDPQAMAASADSPADFQIRWIYFVFGAAVLLPWNGAAFFCYVSRTELLTFYSCYSSHNGHAILPFSPSWFFLPVNIWLLPIFILHRCRFHRVNILHSNIYAGKTFGLHSVFGN